MSQAFMHLTGIAGLALFLAHFASDAVGASLAVFHPQTSSAASEPSPVNRALKTDRSPVAQPSPRQTAVTSVELVGLSQTTVILRDRFGQVLFRSDPITNTTVASKNADIPSITVKETSQSPTVTQSAPPPESERQGGQGEKAKRRSIPAGCEGVVSPLVNHELRRVPSLCLAMVDAERLS